MSGTEHGEAPGCAYCDMAHGGHRASCANHPGNIAYRALDPVYRAARELQEAHETISALRQALADTQGAKEAMRLDCLNYCRHEQEARQKAYRAESDLASALESLRGMREELEQARALVRVAQSQRDDAWKSERYLLAKCQALQERYEPQGEP